MRLLIAAVLAVASTRLLAADPWTESYRLEAVGKYAEAVSELQALARGGHEFALLRQGWLLYLAGRHDEAASTYRRAMQINSYSLDAQLGLTLPLMAHGKWREVAEVARGVLRQSPYHYTALLRLTLSDEAQKQWKSMADNARHLTERYPSDANGWVYLARAEAWLGNSDKARDAYRRALQVVPGHLEASNYLAGK